MAFPETKRKRDIFLKAGLLNQQAPSDVCRGSSYFVRPKVLNGGFSAHGGKRETLRDVRSFFFLNLIPVEVGSVVHSKELDEVGDGREENGWMPSCNVAEASSPQLTTSDDSGELWFVLTVGLWDAGQVTWAGQTARVFVPKLLMELRETSAGFLAHAVGLWKTQGSQRRYKKPQMIIDSREGTVNLSRCASLRTWLFTSGDYIEDIMAGIKVYQWTQEMSLQQEV